MKKKNLKLYLVSQSVNNDYDTYSDFIIACEDEEDARNTSPYERLKWHDNSWYFQFTNGTEMEDGNYSWCQPSEVKVKYIGEADKKIKKGILLSSYHAG